MTHRSNLITVRVFSALVAATLLQGCATHLVKGADHRTDISPSSPHSASLTSGVRDESTKVVTKEISSRAVGSEWRQGETPNTAVRLTPKGSSWADSSPQPAKTIRYSQNFLSSLPATFLTEKEREVVSLPKAPEAEVVGTESVVTKPEGQTPPVSAVVSTSPLSEKSEKYSSNDSAHTGMSGSAPLGNIGSADSSLPKSFELPAVPEPAPYRTTALQESDIHTPNNAPVTTAVTVASNAVDLQAARGKLAQPLSSPAERIEAIQRIREEREAQAILAAEPVAALNTDTQPKSRTSTVVAGIAGLAVLLISAVTFIAYRVRVVKDEYTRKTMRLR